MCEWALSRRCCEFRRTCVAKRIAAGRTSPPLRGVHNATALTFKVGLVDRFTATLLDEKDH